MLEQAGYTVEVADLDNGIFSSDTISSLLATDSQDRFTITFNVYSIEDGALRDFNALKTRADEFITSEKVEINGTNYNMYRGTGLGSYYAYSRIGTTLLGGWWEAEHENAVNELLKTLGYW